jgi:molybdate transport system substrate-binding protein
MSQLKWLTLICGLIACGCQRTSTTTGAQPEVVHVFAAASTKEAVHEVAESFTRATNIAVVVNADDSSRLAQQIAQGTTADLFLSAHPQWVEYLSEKKRTSQSIPYLGNTLVLIVPRGNPAHIHSAADLMDSSVRHVALAGEKVPAGIYARQALTALELLSELAQQKKIILGDNVRTVLAYVERGEVQAGIVYDTDARLTTQVEMAATFAPQLHEPIIYPLALLKSEAEHPAAKMFYDFLQNTKSRACFVKHGFITLPGT